MWEKLLTKNGEQNCGKLFHNKKKEGTERIFCPQIQTMCGKCLKKNVKRGKFKYFLYS